MATYKRWTATEIEYIRENHTSLPDEYLAAKLSKITGSNITTAMIRRQRRKLKLTKSRGRPPINLQKENNEEVISTSSVD